MVDEANFRAVFTTKVQNSGVRLIRYPHWHEANYRFMGEGYWQVWWKK